MAQKKQVAAKKQAAAKPDHGEPKFPYTTEPNSLRRLLGEIPKRPKPTKLTMDTLRSWNVSSNNNASTAIRVLKKLGLLADSGEPTDVYVEFMKTGTGPATLAQRIRETYRILFENAHAPQSESNEELKKLFNIHSGGSEDVLRLQLLTFKVLSEFADFSTAATPTVKGTELAGGTEAGAGGAHGSGSLRIPPVQVDLHIHLPENKSARDYEAIIQDIAKYIYGREIE